MKRSGSSAEMQPQDASTLFTLITQVRFVGAAHAAILLNGNHLLLCQAGAAARDMDLHTAA